MVALDTVCSDKHATATEAVRHFSAQLVHQEAPEMHPRIAILD